MKTPEHKDEKELIMREIIFRGKTKKYGEWVYGYYAEMEGDSVIMQDLEKGENEKGQDVVDHAFYRVLPETVGQYTGRNARLEEDGDYEYVFTDDILEFKNVPHVRDGVGKVVWDNDDSAYYVESDDGEIRETLHDVINYSIIVGNAHEKESWT